eukprot:TRINITY_DN4121_c0_g1_i1.p1 TRINITY_DN4121_c0_g1~~TRINITY_DN4121_c0_g1_i1.p1  ORF type:complete len:162 (-),score=43.47 TRINITY_DN4121_c0_g1_i1:219-704(-)
METPYSLEPAAQGGRWGFLLILLFAVSLLLTLLSLALTAASWEKGDTTCQGFSYRVKIRERTLGFVISTCVFAWLVAAFGIFTLKFKNEKNLFVVLMGLVVFLELFWLVGWALFAKDIDDVRATICDTPSVWAAGFTFTLFSWFLWTFITIFTLLSYKEYS